MNNQRRIRLRESSSLLSKALRIINAVKDEEQDALDNFPENLQNSERYTAMEDAIDNLDDAIESIEQASESINNII